jgi:hypothetical protein
VLMITTVCVSCEGDKSTGKKGREPPAAGCHASAVAVVVRQSIGAVWWKCSRGNSERGGSGTVSCRSLNLRLSSRSTFFIRFSFSFIIIYQKSTHNIFLI